MILPCPDLEPAWFSERRNSMFVEKNGTFSWQITLLRAAVWNRWDARNGPVSPSRESAKGRGRVRCSDAYNQAVSHGSVFFGRLRICSLWSLIRPGSRTPNANTSLPRAGLYLAVRKCCLSVSPRVQTHARKCHENVEQISLAGGFLPLCCSLNKHPANTQRSFQLRWNELRGQVMNLIVTLVSMSSK